mgnify:CR=1 FL=1
MKVLRLHSPGDVRLHEEPTPVPSEGEVLLRIRAVGLCGSDLHWLSEGAIGDARLVQPLVLGHEFAGVVESGELRGQRVAVEPSVGCGRCEFCLEGNPNLCLSQRFAGHDREDGALREYMAWPAHALFPLPDILSSVDGVMLEPLGIAIHAVDLGHLRPGMTVGVFGCGPIGLLVLQVARISGAMAVVVTDKLPHRLQAAASLGATAVFPVDSGREAEEVLKFTNGRGVDVAFEASDDNSAVEAAVAAAKPGARVVLIGIPSDNRTAFTASTARRKGLTFVMVRRMKLAYPRAINLVRRGLVDVRAVVSHRFPLHEFERALQVAHRREGLKVIIEP